MSKIEEIRKRLETPWDSPAAPSQYQILVDAKALLAALDGEWQSERPEEGTLWLSMHPDMRGKRPAVTTPQQLEAARLKINEVLPIRAPGRAALDKLYYRRREEIAAAGQ